MKNFKSYQAAVLFYRSLNRLPKMPAHLRTQLERAASSIALNLAEGNGKLSKKERIRYFNTALCSLNESLAVLHLISADEDIISQGELLGSMIGALIKYLRSH